LESIHAHVGPIPSKVADKEVILSQGWADKVFVEKEGAVLPLLRLERGDRTSKEFCQRFEFLSPVTIS